MNMQQTRPSEGRWMEKIIFVLGILMYTSGRASGAALYRAMFAMGIHFVCLAVVRPIIEKLYSSAYRRKKNLLAYERHPFYVEWKGIHFALRVCMWEPGLCMVLYYIAAKLGLLSEDISDIEKIAYVIVPFLMFGAMLLLRCQQPDGKGMLDKLRRMKLNELQQENVWIIDNKTQAPVESWWGTIKEEGDSARFFDAYMMTLEEMRYIFSEGWNDTDIKGKFRRCCYVVQVDTQEELKQVYDDIYQEHLETLTDGLRKIVIVNVKKIVGNQELHAPKEYKNYAFLYYVEINRLKDLTYQLLGNTCGDLMDGFKVTIGYRATDVDAETRTKLIEDEKNKLAEVQERYFEHPDIFLKKINESVEYTNDIRGGNAWLTNFYNSACVFQNPTRSVMALLDYWELVLRLESIYYYQIMEAPNIQEGELVHANLMTFGRFLMKATKVNPKHHELLQNQTFPIPNVIGGYLEGLREYMYIHFKGDTITFLGLVSLVQVMRNKIIAHGVLNEENAAIVWGITFWATGVLNTYMCMADFKLNDVDDTYEIGFDKTIRAGKLIVKNNGAPCIAAIQKSNGKSYIYVNFFNGELIAPEYVEVNPT